MSIDTLEELFEGYEVIETSHLYHHEHDKEKLIKALNLYIEEKIREELQTMQIIDFDGEDGSMTLDEYLENRIKELEG